MTEIIYILKHVVSDYDSYVETNIVFSFDLDKLNELKENMEKYSEIINELKREEDERFYGLQQQNLDRYYTSKKVGGSKNAEEKMCNESSMLCETHKLNTEEIDGLWKYGDWPILYDETHSYEIEVLSNF